MGSFNVCCSISNLSINGGDKVKFIPLKSKSGKDVAYIKESMLMYSNCFFNPALLPVTGYYNEYGRVVDIERDDNVLAIEKYYKRPIEEILNDITEYDGSSEFGGMFVLDKVYNKLVEFNLTNKTLFDSYVKEEALDIFGFREIKKEEQFFRHPHYKKLFRNDKYEYDLFVGDYGAMLLPSSEKQYLVVDYRDLKFIKDNWNNITKEDVSIYPVDSDDGLSNKEEFEIVKSYLEDKFNLKVGFSQSGLLKYIYSYNDLHKVWFEITGENMDVNYLKDIYLYDARIDEAIEKFNEISDYFDDLKLFNLSDLLKETKNWVMFDKVYKEDVLKGKLKKNMREFMAFQSSMYSCNRFYFPAMNGEQFGNSLASKMLLDISSEIINERLSYEL